MTDKRFKLYPYNDMTYGLFDWVKREYVVEHLPMRFEKICNLLNELAEENEELKKENQSWLKTAHHLDTVAHEDRDYAKRMHKENEELNDEIKELRGDRDYWKTLAQSLARTNGKR